MIRLPAYEDAGRLAKDVAGQFLLEAHARREGMTFVREFENGVLRYRFRAPVTGRLEERSVRVDFKSTRTNPAVHVDGPPCLRHRWDDDSLCMWDPGGPAGERWLVGNGLPELLAHITVHVHCEAQCRGGDPWPKTEMVGEHPRKRNCPTCRGRGR